MNDFEQTQKLIRLKRYEAPPESYFEGFLEDFHQRQRADLMRRSSRSLFFERLSTYLSDFVSSRLVFAGCVAAVVAVAAFVVRPQTGEPKGATSDLPPNFDAPKGEMSPVAAPEVEDSAPPLFLLEPRARNNAETEIFEL